MPRTIGLVIAVPALVRIIVTPIVTHQADRHQALEGHAGDRLDGRPARHDRGRAGGGPIAILLAFAVAMAALSPMLSLSDAYALSGSARGTATTGRCACGARSPSSPAMSAPGSCWSAWRPAI